MDVKYVGNLENGIRNGYGKLYENDILVYEGEWVNNKYDGKGKLYFKNGNVKYDGNWCNGKEVSGINYFENGSLLFESAFDISESIIFDQEGDIDLLNEDIDEMFEDISNNNKSLEKVNYELDLYEPLLNNNLNNNLSKNDNILLWCCKYLGNKIKNIYNYLFNIYID